jgi:hypothetical protein
MAIFWLDDWTSNKSVWVYFDNNSSKNSIKVYSYPFDFSWQKNDFSNSSIKKIKEIKLQKDIQIDKINSQNNALFYFQAISGTWSYYYFTPWQNEFLSKQIEIKLSYKWDNKNLIWGITYYTNTNIVDY